MIRFFSLLALSATQAGRAPKTCLECATINGGDVRMCKWDGMFTDPNTLVCCDRDSTSEYCTSQAYNECSSFFSESQQRFYNYCPQIKEENCGGPINVEASRAKGSFGYDSLQYDPSLDKFDTCYYVVGTPDYEYQEGAKVFLKFTKLQTGVTVHLRSSNGITNSTSVPISGLTLGTPVVDEIYEVNQGDPFIVTVIPQQGATQTGFEFKYWTDGDEYEIYWQYYHDWFFKNPEGQSMMYIAAGCLGFLVLLILCCLGVCCKMCCCSNSNKVESSPTKQRDPDYAGMQQNNTGGLESGNDLELESIQGSEDEVRTQNGESPSFQQTSKAQRQDEINKAYQNPFKKQRFA